MTDDKIVLKYCGVVLKYEVNAIRNIFNKLFRFLFYRGIKSFRIFSENVKLRN